MSVMTFHTWQQERKKLSRMYQENSNLDHVIQQLQVIHQQQVQELGQSVSRACTETHQLLYSMQRKLNQTQQSVKHHSASQLLPINSEHKKFNYHKFHHCHRQLHNKCNQLAHFNQHFHTYFHQHNHWASLHQHQHNHTPPCHTTTSCSKDIAQ